MKPRTNQQLSTISFPLLTTPAVVLAFFALCETLQAVTPPPDGGYPGYNTAEGQNALFSRTTGVWNTALGAFSLYGDTTGNGNTAVGINVLRNNVHGAFNTATGVNALYSNIGDANTGLGCFNTALGSYALFSNTVGLYNTALGASTLQSNHTGLSNTAAGYQALYVNDSTGTGLGSYNSAFGAFALTNNSDGEANSAFGTGALEFNLTGGNNVAVGTGALSSNRTGGANTAIGTDALELGQSGSANIALGAFAGLNTNGNFNILIGNLGVSGESHTIRIGTQSDQTDAYISGVYTATATDRPVYVDANGHLGTLSSSRRYKENIKPMEKESGALFALKPATFHYKKDPASTRSFGLIAEEVAQVSPDLITHDEHGQPQTVRYEAVNAMLLNEFLKEHEAFLEEQNKVRKLEAALEAVNARLKEQDAKIEKISAHGKVSAATPQIVSSQ